MNHCQTNSQILKSQTWSIIKPGYTRANTHTRASITPTQTSVQYNLPISMFKLLSEIRAKEPNSFPLSTLMTANDPLYARTGITFIPPLNANPSIIAPAVSKQQLFAASSLTLPSYFNWFDLDNVATTKKWTARNRTQPYLQPVPDQLACGSCWAVSSASALSDRYAIAANMTNPVLSSTMVLGCIGVNGNIVRGNGSDGCNGGFAADAADLFGTYGTVSNACSSYEWCSNSKACTVGDSRGEQALNNIIPLCSEQQKSCITCDGSNCDHKLFQVKQGNAAGIYAESISGIPEIKSEIFVNGPLVVTMAVFQDFISGAVTGFDKTNGVYINIPNLDSPYANGAASSNTQSMGYHAVTVVGWGIEKNIPDWRNDSNGKTFDVPYWIVRNSWSTAWNVKNKVSNAEGKNHIAMPGYWKHAMTTTLDGMPINREIGMDTPIRLSSGQLIGGGTIFKPNVKTYIDDNPNVKIEPPNPNVKIEPPNPILKTTSSTSSDTWIIVGSVIGGAILLALIGIAIWLSLKKQKPQSNLVTQNSTL